MILILRSTDHSLFINCGGSSEIVGDNEYEEDTDPKGAADFASISEKWGYSSTGTYIFALGAYIATNSYGLNVTGEDFYQTARLAPQSLKYYGLCMLAGSYKVQLHFAEIMFSNNQTFSSLGRRIFDISIQVSKMIFKLAHLLRISLFIYDCISK
jgi:hypothetical protein